MLKSKGRWSPVLKVVNVQIRKLQLEEDWLAAHWYDALLNLEKLQQTHEKTIDEYVETGLDMKWEAALGLESPVYFKTTNTIKPITVKIVSIGKGDRQQEKEEENEEDNGKDGKADTYGETDERMKKKFETAWKAKRGLCGRWANRFSFYKRYHPLLAMGGKVKKMESQDNSDKASVSSSSAASSSSSQSSTTANVQTCAQLISKACDKMHVISQATNGSKSGSSSGEEGDDEMDWKQPLLSRRRLLKKKNKSRRTYRKNK